MIATLQPAFEAVNGYIDIEGPRGEIPGGVTLILSRSAPRKLRGAALTADNRAMTGLGIGTSVGLGVLIGAELGAPGAPMAEYIAAFLFYAFLSGGLFELYRFALTWKHPFKR